MIALEEILRRIEDGTVIADLTIDQGSINTLLDQRDEESFSSRWMTAYQHLEAIKAAREVSAEKQALINTIRELAYLQAYNRWHSPDLAAYISDDLGLIGDAVSTNSSDPWISAMFHGYLSGKFPSAAEPHQKGHEGRELARKRIWTAGK